MSTEASRSATRLTAAGSRWDDARSMGAPRSSRGGGDTRRGLRAAIVALAALVFVTGQQVPAFAEDPLAEALRKKQDLERSVQISRASAERYKQAASQFHAAVNTANTRIADLAVRQAAAETEAEALGYEIQIAEEQLQVVTFQLNETTTLIASLTAQAAAETRQLWRREELYARHLRTTYRHAQMSPLEMLLSSDSLSEFANRVRAMILVNRQDVQLANEVRALRAGTAKKREAAAAKEAEIVGLQDQITRQRASLAEQKAEYDALVRKTQGSIDQQTALRGDAAAKGNTAAANQQRANAETARLNQQLEQAEAQYARLAAELAARSGLGVFTGGQLNTWPVRGPVTSRFGPRWGGFHNGLDIAAPLFTSVVAAAPGQVVTIGRPYIAFGDTAVVVIVAHGSNVSTLYGHLSDQRPPPVSVGQRVAAGQVVGYIGMTGWTTGPHVHFMVTADGRATNPTGWLP